LGDLVIEQRFDCITRAIRFVSAGARFIATNPDVMGPDEGGNRLDDVLISAKACFFGFCSCIIGENNSS